MISVVIPTFNRARILERALETLCDQTLDKSLYELIVVDNNCTDDTKEVVQKLARREPNIRYCVEPAQGGSHARNRGWKTARGAYVGQTDDDCEFPREWLSVAREIIEKVEPAAFGGAFSNVVRSLKPHWFKDSYVATALPRLPEARFLGRSEFGMICGMNMFLRRDLWETIGFFDANLGMVGQKIGYGEDSALLQAVAESGPRQLYYDPRLLVHKVIRPEQMTIRWHLRAAFAAGRSIFKRRKDRGPADRQSGILTQAGRTLIGMVFDIIYFGIWRDRQKYPFVENYVYERWAQYVRELGTLYEQLQHASQFRRGA
jgi:glycosyltransferase involved in cell wall biosynthesis